MTPDDFEDTSWYDKAIETVERGLEVDPWSQGPHPKQHLEYEKTQEDKLGSIWKAKIKLF